MKRVCIIAFLILFPLALNGQDIRIMSDELSGHYYSSSTIVASYSCNDCPVGMQVFVYVDGVLQSMPQSKGMDPVKKQFTITGLEPRQGDRFVRVIFKDSSGKNVLFNESYTLRYRSDKKRLTFLGFGVGGNLVDSSYSALAWPANDIRKAAASITKNLGDYYDIKNVSNWVNEDNPEWGEKAKIRSELELLSTSIPGDGKDVVFIYLSGHGAKGQDDDWYFVTSDTDSSMLESTAFSGAALRSYINIISKKARVYVFVDACYSALLYENRSIPSNVVFYASSRSDETSLEGDTNTQASAFTKAFCEAFSDSDRNVCNSAGEITVKGLYDHINRIVGLDMHYRQHPVLMPDGKYENDVLFCFATERAESISYDVSTLEKEKGDTYNDTIPALLYVIPGGGQFYKKENIKGLIVAGGTVLMGGGVAVCESMRHSFLQKATTTYDINAINTYKARADGLRAGSIACAIVGGGFYIYGIIDSAIGSHHKKNGLQVAPNGITYNF